MKTFDGYCKAKGSKESGVALITALLLLMLMSALAVALMYRVNTEVMAQKSDTGNTVSFYGAEAGMEKMTADLGALFGNKAAPTWCDIQTVQSTPPDLSSMGITFSQYTVTVASGSQPTGCAMPSSYAQLVTQGSNAGLQAQIVPLMLNVTSELASGGEVRMQREIEIAEIPVFQFGVFSQSDLSFFAGPNFDFNGRVQTNGNLYLAEGAGTTLTMHYPIRATLNVIRDSIPNGQGTVAQARTGTVLIPTQTGGCNTSNGTQQLTATSTCRALAITEESTSSGWSTLTTSTYNKMILSGVPTMSLPFVKSGVNAIEIIRRAEPTDTFDLSQSRLYNLAQIRVLLSDSAAELPGGASDAQNVRLSNVNGFPAYANGVPTPVAGAGTQNVLFAEGTTALSGPPAIPETGWINPTSVGAVGTVPRLTSTTWNLLDGYLRVEIRLNDGSYLAVTQEWLQLGFARGFFPVSPGAPNPVNPNAILILQQQANRNLSATASGTTGLVQDPTSLSYIYGNKTRNNWYPINIYDTREGQNFYNADLNKCNVGGVLNLVEIDMNNLSLWLKGTIGASGTTVDYTSQNGYILYFSDRRGMIANPNNGNIKDRYGFEDVVTFNGSLDSGEDVDGNGVLDQWGKANLGEGVNQVGNPYANISSGCTGGAKNWVSGARHGIRLTNGILGNVPIRGDGNGGGFTLASENPAYVLGDFNDSATSASYTGQHSHSAIIADTVTFLSDNWKDVTMFANPTNIANRPATTTRYRVAVASGKGMNFQYSGAGQADYGTDGGVHNFLRYLEDWNSSIPSYYNGSMVSLYYSQYATGTYKSNIVYNPPQRNYSFDTDFQTLSNMPPGTPKLHDVVNLAFHQVFTDPTTDH